MKMWCCKNPLSNKVLLTKDLSWFVQIFLSDPSLFYNLLMDSTLCVLCVLVSKWKCITNSIYSNRWYKRYCYLLLPYPNCELANRKPCLLSPFSTISSHWPDIVRYHGQFVKLAFFLHTLEAKITDNRNTTKRKTATFVKRESNLFNGKRGKKTQFRAKIGSGYTGGHSSELHGQRWSSIEYEATGTV